MANVNQERIIGGQEQLLVLMEEIAKSSKELTEENRSLREELARRDAANKQSFANLEQKLEEVKNSPPQENNPRGRRRCRRRAVVPAQCRRVTKQIYNTLCRKDDFNGFYLDESVESDNNRGLFERVVAQVRLQHGGEEKCPWSPLVIESVLRRYFLSLYEKEKRVRLQTYNEHKKVCRKNGRQRDKLFRRTAALEKVKWGKKKKGRAAEVLSIEVMSSEESCMENDDEGRRRVVKYKVKRLSWESQKLKEIKKGLDKAYKKKLSSRAKDRILPREDSTEASTRKAPEGLRKWANLEA